MKANDIEHRDFLITCVAWQDSLLQSYRSLHITIQGFLVAAGAAVLAVQLTGAIQDQNARPLANAVFNLLFTILIVFLYLLQKKTSTELQGVVASRALDLDHWHQRVILAENPFEPKQRVFTYFKMWQQAKRASVDHLMTQFLPSGGIAEKDAELLIGKGLGHTRRVLDVNLFHRLQLLWIAMVIFSVGISGWFAKVFCFG